MTFWQILPSLYPPIAAAIIGAVAIWWSEKERKRDQP